jgi:shikimate kinase
VSAHGAPPARVVLIGFMGAGKSTVGGLLAARLGYRLVDTDALIEERAGAPVARIFTEEGEPAFREREAVILAELASGSHVVVATGGGAPAQARNRHFFSGDVATFYLAVSLETARRRAQADGTRPLLMRDEASVEKLFAERVRIYEALGIVVDADAASPYEVTERILALL